MKHIGNLKVAEGAKHKKKRIARGPGSGHGGTATRGHKGQKSRSGAKIPRYFEGGQMPLNRRLPKFGFTNRFRVEYQVVNVGTIQKLVDDNLIKDSVNFEKLLELGVISKSRVPLKILGSGQITSAVEVEAHAFSQSAITKIENAGGKAITNG
jgi:large subunit ribosomal protein L15